MSTTNAEKTGAEQTGGDNASGQQAQSTVPFAVPSFAGEVSDAVVKVLDSGWVTTGPQTGAFEQDFADYLGAAHVVAVASCTTALELCLRAMELPPGSPVLTPSLTFCGAINAILHAGHRPVLVDIDEDTLVPSVATTAAAAARTRPAAMIVQNQGGYPVDVPALTEAAGLDRTRVIEDAAHGPGAARDGVPVGANSYAACFSFYATKNMPIGEGGAVASSDQGLADRVRAMRLHGMSKDSWRRYLPGGSWRYDVKTVGLKANMTDIQASIGRAQLGALPGWQQLRAEIVARYDQALKDLPGLVLPQRSLDGVQHAWHLYQVRVQNRDALIADLEAAGVGTSVHFIPASHMTSYQEILGADECATVPVTDRVAEELLSLPLYPGLSVDGQDRVISAVTEALRTRS
ncbi:DegT/DnrJ/EryC1/StrS aminotransferase family protein [Actinomadura barringtoniae]|uniref:DegT/DnrJ/EryC1/StrS aminotransferase family protein n=1 Tax=Actinomadura barringtoniae TaxID=1427535 RepID=A0A939P8Y3_9ACTN|nr:DegT/DnrJ/EryC1/StrS aminotransferase family protein [Actinomadura barringtoniae]MBO2448257.1 DegT/DnrJ/EryC1/StrS aminotransferase family protein [Actinomadura barringtoniae]